MVARGLPICRVFSVISISFLAGVSISTLLNLSLERTLFTFLVSACSLFLLYVVFVLYDVRPLTYFALSGLFFVVGSSYLAWFGQKLNLAKTTEQSNFSGIIVNRPERSISSQKLYIQEGGRIFLLSIPAFPTCYYGDKIVLSGRFQNASHRSLLAKKVSGEIIKPENVSCQAENLGLKGTLFKSLYQVAANFENIYTRILPEPQSSFSAGLILGSKRNLSLELSNALNTTGLTHIIALSGYNVTIIISVLLQYLTGLFNRRKVFWIGLALIFLFVVMTGASSSVVRAAIFSLCLIFGRVIGRKGDSLNLLLLAALAMTLINPFIIIYDIGFQLSFLAFIGILYISPLLNQIIKANFIPKLFRLTLIETLAAQTLVFPLILFYFGRLSIISPFSNLVILPFIPLAMFLAFLVGIFGYAFFPLGKLAAVFAWPLLTAILSLIDLLSQIPYASIEFAKNNIWFLFAYPLIIGLFAFYTLRNSKGA